jgi:hypothetical protein
MEQSTLPDYSASHGNTVESPADPPQSRTELGRRLREIRQRIVASGEPLLSLEELDREIAARRGEREPEAN